LEWQERAEEKRLKVGRDEDRKRVRVGGARLTLPEQGHIKGVTRHAPILHCLSMLEAEKRLEIV